MSLPAPDYTPAALGRVPPPADRRRPERGDRRSDRRGAASAGRATDRGGAGPRRLAARPTHRSTPFRPARSIRRATARSSWGCGAGCGSRPVSSSATWSSSTRSVIAIEPTAPTQRARRTRGCSRWPTSRWCTSATRRSRATRAGATSTTSCRGRTGARASEGARADDRARAPGVGAAGAGRGVQATPAGAVRAGVRPGAQSLELRARARALRAALRGGTGRRVAPDGGKGRARRLGSLAMAVDHRRILATALGRVRGKLKYRPVVFELMPEEFTLLQLQRGWRRSPARRCTSRTSAGWWIGALVEGTGRSTP